MTGQQIDLCPVDAVLGEPLAVTAEEDLGSRARPRGARFCLGLEAAAICAAVVIGAVHESARAPSGTASAHPSPTVLQAERQRAIQAAYLAQLLVRSTSAKEKPCVSHG
jgi:hypothetical protein